MEKLRQKEFLTSLKRYIFDLKSYLDSLSNFRVNKNHGKRVILFKQQRGSFQVILNNYLFKVFSFHFCRQSS